MVITQEYEEILRNSLRWSSGWRQLQPRVQNQHEALLHQPPLQFRGLLDTWQAVRRFRKTIVLKVQMNELRSFQAYLAACVGVCVKQSKDPPQLCVEKQHSVRVLQFNKPS